MHTRKRDSHVTPQKKKLLYQRESGGIKEKPAAKILGGRSLKDNKKWKSFSTKKAKKKDAEGLLRWRESKGGPVGEDLWSKIGA